MDLKKSISITAEELNNRLSKIPIIETHITAITDNEKITKRMVLTQAEYDVLLEKEPTTEYLIVEDEG